MTTELRPLAVPTTPVWEGQPWRLRFWSIWTGQAFSLVGSALTQFVLIWWITLTSGSAGALAVGGMMALLPQALFSPIGGIIADRYPRRLIMIITDMISAGCMLVLVWLFHEAKIQLWHIYTMMFIRGSMQAFQAPAATASTPMLLPPSWVGRAAGLNQLLQGVMTIAAAPLGALLLAMLSFQGALLVDVITAVLGIVPLLIFSIPQPTRSTQQPTGWWEDFRTGAQVVLRNRGLRLLYLIVGLVVLTIMPTFTLTPLLVREHFGGGAGHVAMLEGIAGVGIIVGGALITIISLFKRRIVTILLSFAVSCASVALSAIMPSSLFWLAVVWWGICGISYSTGNAPLIALIQSQVPNHLQGRVLSLLTTLTALATPVGLSLTVPLGNLVGVRGIFILGGGIAALTCLLGLRVPSLLKIESHPHAFEESSS